MVRIQTVILLYIGIICCFKNVLSDDLNLKNIGNSGFQVNNSTKNDCLYTDISPTAQKSITSVFDGPRLLWKTDGRVMCLGVVLVTNPNSTNYLMYIETLSGSDYAVKYYFNDGSGFKETNANDYNEMLKKLGGSSSVDVTFSGYQDHETLDFEISEFESTDLFLKKRKGSLRKNTDYQCSAEDRDCSHKKRILDIFRPQENKRVRFDYEINDGVPTLTVLAKKNKRVTMVYEEQNEIWKGDVREKLVLLSCHSFYGEYRLVEILYSKSNNTYNKYFRKEVSKWVKIDEVQYYNTYEKLKSQIRHIGDISLNVSNVKNADLLYEKYEENDLFKATTYYPMTGYHLTQVGDGKTLIWNSDNNRCTTGIVIKDKKQNEIKYLKLEVLNDNKPINMFYMKENGQYVSITEEKFENSINPDTSSEDESTITFSMNFDDEPENSPFQSPPKGSESPERKEEDSKPEYKEEPHQGTQKPHFDENYKLEEFDLDQFSALDSILEPPKKTREQELVTDSPFGGNQPAELNLSDPNIHKVDSGEYNWVSFLEVYPQDGYVFEVVKYEGSEVWRGNPSKYANFARVFYPGSEAKLGFLSVREKNKSSTIYFVDVSGTLKFVTEKEFADLLDLYSENEKEARSQDSSKRRNKTKTPEKHNHNKRWKPQQGEMVGSYYLETSVDEENRPRSIFVSDINQEDPFHS